MKKQMLSRLGRNGKEKDVVKLSCFPGPCRTGENRVSRFFVSDGRSSVRSKIGRCRITTLRQNTFYYNSRCGFTLIELLVVILIIGILAAVALPQYQVAVEKARMTEAITVAQNVKLAQERYRLANGSYTTVVEDLDISFPGTTSTDYRIVLPSGAQIFVNASSYVYVQNKKKTNTIMFYYEHAGTNSSLKHCHAKQNNQVANQVCKSFGGTSPYDANDCTIGACTIYRLP